MFEDHISVYNVAKTVHFLSEWAQCILSTSSKFMQMEHETHALHNSWGCVCMHLYTHIHVHVCICVSCPVIRLGHYEFIHRWLFLTAGGLFLQTLSSYLLSSGPVFDCPAFYSCIQPLLPSGVCCCREGTVCTQHGLLCSFCTWIQDYLSERVSARSYSSKCYLIFVLLKVFHKHLMS